MARVTARRRRRVVAPALALVALGSTVLAGCGAARSAHPRGATVVTSTDVWGSVVGAVAGGHVTVKAILTGGSVDPHSYTATPSDAAALTDATLVVYNGGDYDPWVTQVLAGRPGAAPVAAYSFVAKDKGDDPPNEHVFYDLDVAKSVANAVADRLAGIDAGDATAYRANAAAFCRDADAVAGAERLIATNFPGASVLATEPVAHYLLKAAGVVDRTPRAFSTANENGTDPSPADMAFVLDLVKRRQVFAVVVNPQTSTPAITGLRDAARDAGVPVTEVTETLPAGTDYLGWQRTTVQQLNSALQSGRDNARH